MKVPPKPREKAVNSLEWAFRSFLDRGDGVAQFRSSSIANFQQKTEQEYRGTCGEGTDHRPSLAAIRNQMGVQQFLEMKRKRCGRQTKLFRGLPSSESFVTLFRQKAKHAKSGLVRQRRQGADGFPLFHDSTLVQISN
jgi:hypothetical protein